MPFGSTGGTAAAAGGGEEYVVRGDPSDNDYEIGDFTADADWHDLDLSGIVTDSDAVGIHLFFSVKDGSTNKVFKLRENGRSNVYGAAAIRTYIANVTCQLRDRITCDENQVIEYYLDAGVDQATITVVGWWKPAS